MDLMEKIASLGKRRGFIYPGSEIYGGLANTYDYGPLGVELKRNITELWWKFFVHQRTDMYPLDSSILMSPKVWEASGHTQSFTNVLIDCKNCQYRTRADHLIEDNFPNQKVEGKPTKELDEIIRENKLKCPKCGMSDWTPARNFNQLFETSVGIITSGKSTVYLRGEIAQGLFVNFGNVVNSFHPRLPFGIAQSGKAFRNEITMGKFTFRTLEFDLAEFEYFIKEEDWERQFDYWKGQVEEFVQLLGIDKVKTRWRPHTTEELAHYSKRTEDLEYEYPFGFKEWLAVAYRTNFDLRNHTEHSGKDLSYTDPDTGEKLLPYVIEPTFGISRSVTTVMVNAYHEDEDGRVVLKLHPRLAPYKAAVFPLLANKPELVEKADKTFKELKNQFGSIAWDGRGNIGKRYLAQDEIGTPFCITVDFDSLKDETVTVRDRDTKKQQRVSVDKLVGFLQDGLK